MLETIQSILILIGLPTIIGCAIYIGRKLQVLEDMQKNMEIVKLNLNVVSNYLISSTENFNPTELQSFSPYQLTEEGLIFLNEHRFPEIVNEYRKEFFSIIQNENPKLKYDVEIAAIKAIYSLANQDFMKFLKIFFYNNPQRDLENTAPTLGIYLRDEYLKEHPEIIE